MQAVGTITLERINNTINGNPRYKVWFSSDDGQTCVVGNTKGDSSFVYSMPKDGTVKLTWHETKTFRNVITNIERV